MARCRGVPKRRLRYPPGRWTWAEPGRVRRPSRPHDPARRPDRHTSPEDRTAEHCRLHDRSAPRATKPSTPETARGAGSGAARARCIARPRRGVLAPGRTRRTRRRPHARTAGGRRLRPAVGRRPPRRRRGGGGTDARVGATGGALRGARWARHEGGSARGRARKARAAPRRRGLGRGRGQRECRHRDRGQSPPGSWSSGCSATRTDDIRRIEANAHAHGATLEVVHSAKPPGRSTRCPIPTASWSAAAGWAVLDAALARLRPEGRVVATFAPLDRAGPRPCTSGSATSPKCRLPAGGRSPAGYGSRPRTRCSSSGGPSNEPVKS